MPNLTCDEDINNILGIINPITSENFLNPNYDASLFDDWDKGPYTINFYYDGTPYDFGKFYVPKTMVIRDVFGFESGDASFEIWDYGVESFNMPFYIPGQMEVHIGNQNGTEWFHVGRVQDVQPMHINRRPDGTENRRLKISTMDLKIDFKRWLYSETYTGVTTYGVIKDAIANHSPFDASEIDGALGLQLSSYRVNEKYASEVIQEMLDLEITTTFYLDPITRKVYLGELTDPAFNFLTVEESASSANYVYNYFNIRDFFISRQTQILRNRVVFWFTGAYNEGTVAVTNGGRTMIGTGTSFLNNVRKSARIRIEGDDGEYSAQDVLSDTDILLASAVERTTASGLSYSASGYRDRVIVDDSDSIATMAAVLDENFSLAGVFEVKMPERPNALTREQARILAQAYVNRMTSNAILRGQAVTENTKVKTAGIKPGWSITFNLPTSRQLQATVVVQELLLEDKSSATLLRSDDPTRWWYTNATDGRIDPHHKMTFSFTDRRLLQDQVIERTLQDIRDVQITDDEIIEAIASARELIAVSDCVGVVGNIGPNGSDSDVEEIELEDEATSEEITPGGAYYTSPTSGGQTPAYCLDSTHYAFAS